MKEQIQAIQDLVTNNEPQKNINVVVLDVMALMAQEIESLKSEIERLKELASKGGANVHRSSGGFSIG